MKLFRKYRKSIFIFVLVAVVVSSFVIGANAFNPAEAQACRDQGCNVLFWKFHIDKWVGHHPSDTLRTLFSGADQYGLGGTTLINALRFNWCVGASCTSSAFAAKVLLMEGVAARLNASHPQIDYHLSGTQVTKMVSDALASGNPITMFRVAISLAGWNNAGCPFCQPPHYP